MTKKNQKFYAVKVLIYAILNSLQVISLFKALIDFLLIFTELVLRGCLFIIKTNIKELNNEKCNIDIAFAGISAVCSMRPLCSISGRFDGLLKLSSLV